MSKINTNMAGVTTLYHLQNKEESMNKALERISSGLRLNNAVDDAAGASIVNRMTSQIKGLEAAIRNAADAISLTQTAEGAIEEVTQILHRMRELSVQSANGVYTGQDRQAIQNEVGALQEELNRIAESSTFNGVKMLNGSFLDTTFQVGFQPNDTATLSIEDVKPTGLGEYILSTSVTNAENYLQTESEPLSDGLTSNSVESMGTVVNISVFEGDGLRISTVDETINNNPVIGVGTDAFKAFVAADTGTDGAFSIEVVEGQTGTSLDADFFEINAATGEVRLQPGINALDFEDQASNSGDSVYEFNVVYTNSEGVKFVEKVALSVGNHLNSAGETEADIKTDTASRSPDTIIKLNEFSQDFLLKAKELGMVVNEDGTLDTTNFSGSFRIPTRPAGGGVSVDSADGTLRITTDSSRPVANRLDAGTINFDVVLYDEDLNVIYTEDVTLNSTSAAGEFARTDRLAMQSPSEVVSATNITNVDITTNTASGTPTTIINSSKFLPTGTTGGSLGFDNETTFVISSGALAGTSVIDNGDGTFDLAIDTDNTLVGAKLPAADATVTIEARDTTTSPDIQEGGRAKPTQATSSSIANVITGGVNATETITEANLTNISGVTSVKNAIVAATAAATPLQVVLNGAPTGVTVTDNSTAGAYDFDITMRLDEAAPPVLVAGNHNFEVEYQDHLGNVVFTETIVMTVKNYVQHEFTINLAVEDGTGQGALDGELSIISTTENDNGFTANAIAPDVGGAIAAGSGASSSTLDIQTNAPTGTVNFTFNQGDISDLTNVFATDTPNGAVFRLGSNTPPGITLTDNGGNTFDISIAVDPNSEMLPVDALEFEIEIYDANDLTVVEHVETINLNITDLKQNIIRNSVIEDKVGKIDIEFNDVLEAGKVKIPFENTSDEMKAFIKENQGGSYSISGADADKFRVDPQNGQVVSKSYIHFNSEDADANIYNIDITYTIGDNSFTDKSVVNIINNPADDNPTQAAGRPLVGADSIEAASLVDEDEDIIIYGNVGTAQIDVNGKASAYELVQAINSRQGETGVYANAKTSVNISFPDQFEASDDAISFMLTGMNDEPILVSGNVDFGIVGGRDANVRGLADAINNVSGKTGISAKVSPNGATLHMVSNEGHDILVETFTMSVNNIPMNISATDDELNSIGDVQQLNRGLDDTFRSTGKITFHSPYVFSVEASKTGINGGGLFQLTPGAAKLSSVSELDVLTVDNAKKMLTAVDAALVRIDLERSDLGATMSRMEHTIRNLSNIVVNTKAARSRIQDANIAEETTEMTKAQVLSQAAQAMLAQANRTSQSILSLLQG